MKSKYNVNTTAKGKDDRTYNGVVYDSALEMRFYKEWIEPRINDGSIVKVETQVSYTLQPGFDKDGRKVLPIKYKSDFDVTFADGIFVSYDVKGMVKPMDNLKRKLMWYQYPEANLTFIGYSKLDGGWVPVEDITAGRKQRKKAKERKDV